MSRRLAEEAMTYFDECVSLSAFDGSDFSSQDDHQINSTLGSISTRNSRFLSNGCSTYAVSDYPITQFEHHEVCFLSCDLLFGWLLHKLLLYFPA